MFSLRQLLLLLVSFSNLALTAQSSLPQEMLLAIEHYNLPVNQPHEKSFEQYALLLKQPPIDNKNLHLGLEMGFIYHAFELKRYDLALRHLNIAQQIYNTTQPGKPHYWLLMSLGKAYFHRGNHQIAGQSFLEALRTEVVRSTPALEDEVRDFMIRIYNLLPAYNLDEAFFNQAIDIKLKLNDRKGALLTAIKFVDILHQEKKYKASLDLAEKCILWASELNRPEDVLFAQLGIAQNLIRLNKLTEALSLLNTLKPLISNSDFHFLHRYETAMGDYSMAIDHPTEAERHYQNALPVRPGNVLELYVRRHQMDSYLSKNNYAKAFEAQSKYLQALNESFLTNIMPAVVASEEQTARKKLADEISYLNAQNLLKDSLYQSQQLLTQALAASNQYQQQQIADQARLSTAMEKQVELQKEQLRSEKTLRWLYLASSAVLMLMGVWIYSLYHAQKKKNNIISKQSGENEMLMKEVHHRVKNNLQIISSLLDLQAHSMQDSHAAEAIKEGKNRVQSMALIHQNLYHEGNIRTINIEEYIRHMAIHLFQSYHKDPDKISLVTNIEAIQLDVDTVIPLGLIVNELITNTLKYAFKESATGKVEISLHKQNQALQFLYKDSGPGFPSGWQVETTTSFGYKLIKSFAKKIKAQIKTYNDGGACIELYIQKFKE